MQSNVTKWAIAIASMAVLSSAQVFAEDYPKEDVKSRCTSEWPDDFFMQKGCVDLQRDSFNRLPKAISGMPADLRAEILGKCTAEWATDFFMRVGCVELQRDSYSRLPTTVAGLPADVGKGILDRCETEWVADFFMQAGCADLQAESWRSLNN